MTSTLPKAETPVKRLGAWLEERIGWSGLAELARHKTVPVHRHTLWYYFGGMTLFFFLVQVGTGILLMLYYRPSAEEAYESVQFLMTRVPFGWLVRSIHSWSANLLVGAAVVHLLSVFFLKAYRRPRELTWMSGALLLFLALGFGFSGYLLPWNTLAYFATKVGTDIAGTVPVIGGFLLRFLRGGDRVTGGTLSRFYGWHVAILPAISSVLLGIHLVLVQKHGMSVPPSAESEPTRRTMPFVPNFLLRDLFGWTLALAALAALAAYAPWELGVKADPFAPAPADIRPEWYFLFMFETLKLVPGGAIGGVEYEAIAILAFSLGGAILLCVPFLDRAPGRSGASRIFTMGGWMAVVYIVAMTAKGYRSFWPIVLPAAGLIAARFISSRAMAVILIGASLLFVSAPSSAAERGRAPASDAGAPPGPASVEGNAVKVAKDSCVACHATLGEIGEQLAAPVKAFEQDVHAANGLGCASCHGGDPSPERAEDSDAAMDRKHGFLGKPARGQIAEFCGRCHSDAAYMKKFKPAARVDQVTEYRSSVHGKRNAAGDLKVATCIDCHKAHGILPVSSPRSPAYATNVPETCGACHANGALMAAYGHKDNPLEDWRKSVHAEALLVKGDLSAPACNDCHGNHGAVPPGVTSLAFVCGQCHAREAMLFRESFKKKLFDESGAAECTTCHSNHAISHPRDAMIGTGEGTVCSKCHRPGDVCDQQSVRIRRAINTYVSAVSETQEVLGKAERAGMEVSEEEYTVKKESVSGLVETRALIHSFNPDRLVKRAEEGTAITLKAKQAGLGALEELDRRRKGLAVSLVFVALLLAGLLLKIRQIERDQKSG
jgi:cytochrome b6